MDDDPELVIITTLKWPTHRGDSLETFLRCVVAVESVSQPRREFMT